MGRPAKTKADGGPGLDAGSGPSQKENIVWAGALDTLLAYKMKDEYKDHWKPGRKVSCAKRWAKALAIEDKDGLKTKAHVEILVARWKVASIAMMGTGWGDKTKRVKKNGEWVVTIITAEEQLHDYCLIFTFWIAFWGQRTQMFKKMVFLGVWMKRE